MGESRYKDSKNALQFSHSFWYHKEIEEGLDDIKNVLHAFWVKKIKKNNLPSVNNFKNFIIQELYKEDEINQQKVHRLFEDALNGEINFKTFFNEAKKFGLRCIRIMNFAEKLVTIRPMKIQPVSHPLTFSDIEDVQCYMQARNISASIALRTNDDDIIVPDFKENKAKFSFAMHSIGKVFTGMLVMLMVQKGFLSEKDLHRPIQLDSEDLSQLSPAVQTQLGQVTLHQCMTHHAGMGDYLGLYLGKLKNGQAPEMKKVEDFLSFVDKEVSPIGKYKYSNAGILLVGLAIKHAYQKKTGKSCDYNKLLWEFIIKNADLTSFSTHPPENALTNPDDPLASFIVGSPGGGYWITAHDLAKFGKWIYDQCQMDPELVKLIQKYGQEFYSSTDHSIAHMGNIPSSSAHFMVSLKTGAVVATLSDQPNVAIELNLRVQRQLVSDRGLDVLDEEMTSSAFGQKRRTV